MGRILDFEEIALRIQPAGPGGLCAVQVTQSSYGSQASCQADFAAWSRQDDRLVRTLESSLRGGRRRNLGGEPDDEPATTSPQAVGDRLFRTLFAGPVLDTFLLSLGRVETRPDTGLRIRLLLDPSLPDLPEISALPWELLYRSETRDFLARNPLTPLVRSLEVPRLTAPAPLAASLRILVVRSSPRDLDPLDLESERDRLQEAWGGQQRVVIDFLDQPTLLALRRKLIGEPFHVLHFMGHGDFDAETGEGVLVFENAMGASVPVSGRVLAEALKDSRWLRLVCLNACDTAQLPRRRGQDPFSGVASALLLAGLPAVVAMQVPISDEAALVFSQQFYTALAAGFPVDAAAAEARLAIHLSFPTSWEWATPALFMSVPDGRILLPPGGGEEHRKRHEVKQVGKTPNGATTTLHELDQLDMKSKLALLAGYESQVREHPEDDKLHFALGLSYLDLKRYDQALDSLKKALNQGSRETGLYFYIALASLGGKQPRTLTFTRIKEIESYLKAALDDGESPEALLLSTIIKYDYYRSNGLRVPPPPIEDLMAAVRHCQSSPGDAHMIAKHLTVPAPLRDLLSATS